MIVTHNMQQAARVSDSTAFMLTGELVEFSPTPQLFTTPTDPRTEAYITGRFGMSLSRASDKLTKGADKFFLRARSTLNNLGEPEWNGILKKIWTS